MKIPAFLLAVLATFAAIAQPSTKPAPAEYERVPDIIYGRSFGTALTFDLLKPKVKPNGLGVILVVSGGWFSSPDAVPMYAEIYGAELLRRGYTLFAVTHGSVPQFTIVNAVADLNRSVRFIRAHVSDYKIDPDRLGITGGSAGGHLSLMIGCANAPEKKDGNDPIEKVSSRVQCVAAFYPPTDFLDYGGKGIIDLDKGVLASFRFAFDFRELDEKSRRLIPVTNARRIVDLYREVSPLHHVDRSDPPVLIIHGDKDELVPIQQATSMIAKLKEAGVEAKLITREGKGHGWPDFQSDQIAVGDFFDAHLRNASANAPSTRPQSN